MIGEKQRQDVDIGGTAIQSGGDTNVTIVSGLSVKDVLDIIEESKLQQLTEFKSLAEEIATERCNELNRNIAEKIQSEDINREAFQEPDFQFLIGQAQNAFARSGETDIADVLTGLISERSKQQHQSIQALTISQAVEIVPKITKRHIDQITFLFCLSNVKFGNCETPEKFVAVQRSYLDKLIDQISDKEASYGYLSSLGCLNPITGSLSLHQIYSQYEVFSMGSPKENIIHDPAFMVDPGNPEKGNKEVIVEVDRLIDAGLLVRSHIDGNTYFPAGETLDQFNMMVDGAGLSTENSSHIFHAFAKHPASIEKIEEVLEPLWPNYSSLKNILEKSPISGFRLTSTGMAIAHSNLRENYDFNTNIDIWIKE